MGIKVQTSLLFVAKLKVAYAALVKDILHIRSVQGQSLIVIINGLLPLFSGLISQTTIIEHGCILSQLQSMSQIGDGCLDIALFEKKYCSIGPGGHKGWIML